MEEQKTDEAKCFCSLINTLIGNCEIKRNIKNNIDKTLNLEVLKKVPLSSLLLEHKETCLCTDLLGCIKRSQKVGVKAKKFK